MFDSEYTCTPVAIRRAAGKGEDTETAETRPILYAIPLFKYYCTLKAPAGLG